MLFSFSKFCGFVCNHFTFCQQLYNANSHRGWKTPLKSSSPTFLMKLQQGAQVNYIQSGLEYLHRQRLHNLSRHPASPSQQKCEFFCSDGMLCAFVCATVSSPVTGHYWEEFGFLLLIPFQQVYSNMDKKDLPEPAGLISSEIEQLSYIFSDNSPSWSPLSNCLSVITPTDPTIYLNYWSLFSLIQLFNTGKYLQWLSSAIQFYSNPLSSKYY